jgi:predicted alpha/beta hydrolase family esterase
MVQQRIRPMNTRSLSHPFLIVPGLGGSGPGHWQASWCERFPDCKQVLQENWDRPELDAWLTRLRAAVDTTPDAILVGHSLGCVLIAHLVQADPRARVAGALLVAPADVESCAELPDCLAAFGPVPRKRLPFPSITVVSTDDPYITVGRAQAFAQAWGSELRNIGTRGHINIAAGFGPWPEGEEILAELCRRINFEAPVPRAASIAAVKKQNPFAYHNRS